METSKKNIFTTKLFLCFFALLITIIICGIPASTVQAEVKVDNPKKTFYVNSTKKDSIDVYYAAQINFTVKVSDGDSIVESSVCSNNEKVAKVEAVWKGEDGKTYYFYAGYAKYPGTADISFEDQTGKKYTVTAEVLPYENPIESIKVTNIKKGKNFAEKADYRYEYTANRVSYLLPFSKKTSAPQIKVKAKKGWTIKTIYIGCAREKNEKLEYYDKWGEKKISNINARTKTVKLKKVDKGDGLVVAILVKNNKNGATQIISYGAISNLSYF